MIQQQDFSKTEAAVGIDIGRSALKIVVLKTEYGQMVLDHWKIYEYTADEFF